jgi:hypothetical protein
MNVTPMLAALWFYLGEVPALDLASAKGGLMRWERWRMGDSGVPAAFAKVFTEWDVAGGLHHWCGWQGRRVGGSSG